jgi:zinc protease
VSSRRPAPLSRALVAAAVLASAAAWPCTRVRAEADFTLPAIEQTTLENGLRVFVAAYRGLPIVDFTLLIGSGAAQDPEGKDGLASFVAGALRRGTEEREAQAFAEAVEFLGGDVGAVAGYDSTLITGAFLAKDAGSGLDLIAEMVLRPAFSRGELERERAEVLAGLSARYENPSAIASLCYAAFLYGDHPYGRSVEGRTAGVEGLKKKDVRAFHDRYYRPNNAIAVAIGDVPPRELIDRVRAAFGQWKPGEPPPPAPPPPAAFGRRRILLVDDPGATQAQIRLGNVAIARSDPGYVTASVVNTVLGGGFSSRLIEQLRVKHSLTYGAWSTFVAYRAPGDFRLGTFTKVATTATALRMALAELGRFREDPPTAPELEKARNYLRGQFPFELQEPSALSARLADDEFHGLGLEELAAFRSRVARVRVDDAVAFVRRHVPDPESVAVVVVAPAGEVSDGLASLGPVQVTTPRKCLEGE